MENRTKLKIEVGRAARSNRGNSLARDLECVLLWVLELAKPSETENICIFYILNTLPKFKGNSLAC